MNANSEGLSLKATPGPSNRKTHKVQLGGSFNYSEAFLNNTLGVALSLSESNQHNEQHSVVKSYTFPGATGVITGSTPGYMSQYQILDGPKFANRRSLGLNVDYKLGSTTTVALKNTFNNYEAQIRDRTLRFIGGTPNPGYTIEDASFAAGRTTGTFSFFNKYSRDWSSRLAVRHKFSDYTINYDAGFSKSTNHYKSFPNTARGINTQRTGIGLRIVQPQDGAAPTLIEQTSGPDMYNFANHTLVNSSTQDTDRNSADFILSGKLDARRDFAQKKFPFYLQSGYSWRQQERTILRPDPNFVHVGPDGVAGGTDDTLVIANFYDSLYNVSPGFGLRAVPWGSPIKLADYVRQNQQAYIEGNQADGNFIRKVESDRFFQETVQAVYGMGNFKVGKLNLLAGLRLEYTDFVAKDYARDNSVAVLRQQYTRRTTRVDFRSPVFRNVQLKYVLTPDLHVRASFTDGQGRQNFSDLVPSTVFDDDNLEIRQNNAGLKPRYSENYDVSVEYYFKPAGFITVGWFQKDIRNYTTAEEITLGADNDFGDTYNGWTLVTRRNAGDATYQGAEIDYRQQLKFLPGWLKGITIFGNATRIYEAEGNFGGTTTVTELAGLITKSYNYGVRFEAPNRKFYVQAKQNFRGEHLRGTGTNPTYNSEDSTWDFSAGSQLTKRFDVELVVRNAFVEPRRVSQHTRTRYINWNEYGAQYSLIFRTRL